MKSIITLLILTTILASENYRGLKRVEVLQMQTEQRLALVVGINEYSGRFDSLTNPRNDAKLMRKTLEEVGFEVFYGEDMTRTAFMQLFNSFQEKLSDKDGVGLVYFAGHGIEVDGENFLIPSDSVLRKQKDAEIYAIRLDFIVESLQKAKNRFNVIVLDACRNNPFRKKKRGAQGGGLARLQNARGILVAYATEEGKVAYDGEDEHSIFTQALSENIKNPISIEDVFKNTRETVWKRTEYDQFPAVYNQAIGQFYFTLPEPEPERLAMRTDANGSVISVAPPKMEEDNTMYWLAGGGGALLLGGGAFALGGGSGGGDEGGDEGGGAETVAVATDTTVELTWSGTNDLDLIVEDPCGQRIASYNTSATCKEATGTLTQQANTEQIDSSPTEIVTFAGGGADGAYYVYVSDSYNRDGSATDFEVKVVNNEAEGSAIGSVEAGKIQPVTSFTH